MSEAGICMGCRRAQARVRGVYVPYAVVGAFCEGCMRHEDGGTWFSEKALHALAEEIIGLTREQSKRYGDG